MKKLFLISSLGMIFLSNFSFSQTFEQNTTFLSKKLTELAYDKKDSGHPKFSFKGCQMNMDINTKDDGVSFDMKLSWQLKDVQKVSYAKNKDGYYDFVMNVPADRLKMKMGFGDDNSIGGSFNISDDKKDGKKESDNKTSFDLKTKDESLVKDLALRMDNTVKTCKNMK